jgi:Tfp pilus assembly protein PilN
VITTNLSTRPFYNERAANLWIAVLAVIVIAATAFNVARVLQYAGNDTTLGTQASQQESQAADLLARAAKLRTSVDPRQIESASTEAKQANELIDRRTFSWTDLFNHFEATLPDDVRITSVRPEIDPKRGVQVTMSVVARSVEDIDQFMENLERTGAFSQLNPAEDRPDESGLITATIDAVYAPEKSRVKAPAPAGTKP